jgi:hypothetical protein
MNSILLLLILLVSGCESICPLVLSKRIASECMAGTENITQYRKDYEMLCIHTKINECNDKFSVIWNSLHLKAYFLTIMMIYIESKKTYYPIRVLFWIMASLSLIVILSSPSVISMLFVFIFFPSLFIIACSSCK